MIRFFSKFSFKSVPRTVWVLGIATLLIESSSQIVQSLLPVFLTTVLGMNMKTVGVLDGLAKAAAAFGRVVFGWLSDKKWGRKPVLLLGYGLMALGRPLFPMAQGAGLIIAGRFCDTISRGIAFVSRDALTGDVTKERRRGKSFGLMRSMTEIGAFIGPLSATGLMFLFLNDYRLVFWFAVIPAFLALGLIAFGVPNTPIEQNKQNVVSPFSFKGFSKRYWILMGIVLLVILARLSNSLLIVRADQLGLDTKYIPFITLALSVSGILSAYPFGTLSDKIGRMRCLALSLIIIAIGHGILSVTTSIFGIMMASILWGVHSGIVWSILPAMVIERVAPKEIGKALGVYSIVVGAGVFIANIGSGALWDSFGAHATFEIGFWYSLCAFLILVCFLYSKSTESKNCHIS